MVAGLERERRRRPGDDDGATQHGGKRNRTEEERIACASRDVVDAKLLDAVPGDSRGAGVCQLKIIIERDRNRVSDFCDLG